MVAAVILMILIAGISSILTSGGRLWGISGAQADISSSARNVLYRMSEELSQAGRSTLIISPAQDSITFQTPSSFTAGNINWGNQIQYSLGGINGRQLVRNQAGSASTAIGGDYITLLRFNWSGTDSIEIQLALSKQSTKGDILSMQLGSQVRLRN
jgi:Tfp pilus assembly protein PilW